MGDKPANANEKLLDEIEQKLKTSGEYRTLIDLLSPLVDSLQKSDAKLLLKPDAKQLRNRFEKSATRMLLFKKYATAEGHDEDTILGKAFTYLGLFESSVTNLIDLVLMIFIANHHDFFVYYDRKYAKKLNDLDNSPLGDKLLFLNQHALQIFSQNLNKNLRNKIAHLDFDINLDGTLMVGQQKIDIDYETAKLMDFVLLVAEVLSDCGVSSLLKELAE